METTVRAEANGLTRPQLLHRIHDPIYVTGERSVPVGGPRLECEPIALVEPVSKSVFAGNHRLLAR
jgi:hypothetical protein